RNTDDRYGVKVVSEEVGFLDWEIEPELYLQPYAFPQLKALGFETLPQLKDFAQALQQAMVETDYNLQEVAQICQHRLGDGAGDVVCEVPALEEPNQPRLPRFLATLDVAKLKQFAMAFMEDGHDICNVAHYFDQTHSARSYFGMDLRQFRRQRPWLRENLIGRDRFNRISDDERTVFYGYRIEPQAADHHPPQEVVMVTHMGGTPMTVNLSDWLQLTMADWRVALATPGLDLGSQPEDLRSFELRDGEGVLLVSRAD
ncbi:MAG: glucosylglycerol hydrolase, partial [Nodosilinea sp.]